jgi:hypothetical protein
VILDSTKLRGTMRADHGGDDSKEARMLVNRTADRDWKPTPYPGIERNGAERRGAAQRMTLT